MTEHPAPVGGPSPSPSPSTTSSSASTIPTTNGAETTISPASDTISVTHGTPEPERATPRAAKTASKATSRRGHFKSRLGCFNCKRRRVKCNEARPSCAPCTRLGLCCSYPTPVDPASSAVSIRANPSALEMEDLRFYHQFLTKAFPTVPFRGDHVWMECTAMSHQYQLLAHAVLALGASHLTRHGNTDYTRQALGHRVTAIRMMNEQFGKELTNAQDIDALFGSVLCLMSQAALMPEGMIEYIVIARGASILMRTIVPHEKTLFAMFTKEAHLALADSVISENLSETTDLDGFWASLQQVRTLLTEPRQVEFYEGMAKCVDGARVSALDAWGAYALAYQQVAFWTNEEFNEFINPENYSAQLLIIHLFLLDYVLGPLCVPETMPNNSPARKLVVIGWARDVAHRLPGDVKAYAEWLTTYCNKLEHGDWRYLLSP